MTKWMLILALALIPAAAGAQTSNEPGAHDCSPDNHCCKFWKIELHDKDGRRWGLILRSTYADAVNDFEESKRGAQEVCKADGKSWPCGKKYDYDRAAPPRCANSDAPHPVEPCTTGISASVAALEASALERSRGLLAIGAAADATPGSVLAGRTSASYAIALKDGARKLADVRRRLDIECAEPAVAIDALFGPPGRFDDRHTRRQRLQREAEELTLYVETTLKRSENEGNSKPKPKPTPSSSASPRPTKAGSKTSAEPETEITTATRQTPAATPVAQPTKSRCPSMNWSDPGAGPGGNYCSKCEDFCERLTFARELDACVDAAGADYAGAERAFKSCCLQVGGELASKGGPCD